MTFADQLARLRVAVETGTLPASVGRWAVAQLEARASRVERVELRDDLLRQAGELVGGSRWARARTLANELAALPRRRPPLTPVAELLTAADELEPCPTSPRRIWELLV